METGIGTREYKMCDTEFTNRGATNMKGYEKVRNIVTYGRNGWDSSEIGKVYKPNLIPC